jgi:hypothetical protein
MNSDGEEPSSRPPNPLPGVEREKPARLAWLRRGVTVLVSLLVLEYLVLPQVAGTRRALAVLGELRPGWVVAGVALECLSLVAFSLLTRSVLPDRRPSFSWILRSDVTGLGVSHVLPAGAAASSTLRYRLLHEGGAPAEDVVVGLAVQGVGSMLVLVALLWVALVASVPLAGFKVGYVVAAAVAALVIGLVVSAVVGVSRGHDHVHDLSRRLLRPLPTTLQRRVEHALDEGAAQVTQLLADPGGLRRLVWWALWNWVLDAASLWVFLAAYGWWADPIGLAVGYGLANTVAALPISPGGLGVIEGILIPSLVAFGGPSAEVVLGVVTWRLLEFWAPIPSAAVCFASLRMQSWREVGEMVRRWEEVKAVFRDRT